jgi:hypothetical protein
MDTQTTGSTQSARKKTKEVIQHYDKLGVEIFPGDYVVAPSGYRETMIAKVIKLNPKMLTICRLGAIFNANAYASETVKLDPNLVTMYILRNKK